MPILRLNSVAESKAISYRSYFKFVSFYFLTLFNPDGSSGACCFKRAFSVETSHPLVIERNRGFFQKIFLQSNFCDLQTDHRKN